MEVSFKKFKLINDINKENHINLTRDEVIEIAKKFSSIDANKDDFIRASDMDFGGLSIINPKLRERKSLFKKENIWMKYHDTSPDWKEFPKRKNSLIFSNVKRGFGHIGYYVIPLDKLFDLPIAATFTNDFNWTKVDWKENDELYVHDYLKNPENNIKGEERDSLKSISPNIDKKLLTPEALNYILFKYKDYEKMSQLSNYIEDGFDKEFYTEMPCILIKYFDSLKSYSDGEGWFSKNQEVYDLIKNKV